MWSSSLPEASGLSSPGSRTGEPHPLPPLRARRGALTKQRRIRHNLGEVPGPESVPCVTIAQQTPARKQEHPTSRQN